MAMITTRLSDALSSVNFPNPTGAGTSSAPAFFFNVLQCLLSAGWTHWASGTGTSGTFSTTPGNGNLQITNAGAQAAVLGLDRNNAWFILRCPAAKRQILVQRGTSSSSRRAYYSALDTFIGTGFGTVSATVPPSAADQGQFLGASAAYDGQFGASTNDCAYFHCVAFSDPVNTDVYAFYAWATQSSGNTVRWVFMLEGTDGPSADADPVVLFAYGNNLSESAIVNGTSGGTANLFRGWFKMNLSGEAFVAWSTCRYGVPTSFGVMFPAVPSGGSTTGAGPDPIDAAEVSMRPLLLRGATSFATENGVKGLFTRLRLNGTYHRGWPARVNPASASECFIAADLFWIPWPANTPPAV